MPWRRMVISYGWSITVRELEASPRWSAETKAGAGVIAGIVMSVPLALGIGLPYVYWLLTGRGPWRRYGLSSSVVVNPLTCSVRGCQALMFVRLGQPLGGRGCVGALEGWGVSADAQAYFGARLGLATGGRRHDV
jgi:hypothetical protein